MISIYDRNETDFFHNGIILTEAIYCTIEEELNGKYVLELIHPIDKQGKWQYLEEENIIKADGQLFRIYSTEKTLDRIYVYARHIFYDLLHNFLEDVRPTNLNGAAALDWILSHTLYPHPFTSTSDIDTINTRYFIRTNPVDAILGSDGIAERWGGELVRDNFTIKLLKQRGSNKGAKIVYGKNLLGLEVKRDMDTVVTRIMPVGRDELLLPEKYVDSPLIDNYAYPRVREIKFDIGIDEETTEEEAYEKLRQACIDLYEKNKIDIPYININVNLVLLENTEEYKHLKHLERVELGDIVSCTDNPLKITFEAKVIRVKKDVIANKNVEVELGQYKKGISNTIRDALKNVSEEIKNTTSNLEKAIEDATELLTNALGGHVLKRPGELLIMDTDDPATAEKVWRWNLNGLGYSNNGINGPYGLAMTMDGQIVADFITTGTLNANLIKTGTIKSYNGNVSINLDDDNITIENGAIIVKDLNNSNIITANGLKVKYVFISSGELKGWQKVGIWNEYGNILSHHAFITAAIPDNLTIETAVLRCKSMPRLFTGWPAIPDGYYHARNMKLYKISDESAGFIDYPASSEYDLIMDIGGTDISSAVWGSSTWSPTGQGIKYRQGDVKNYLDIGTNIFLVKSTDSISQANERYGGGIQFELIITGYLRG